MSRWQSNLGWGLLMAVCAGVFWLAWSPGEAQVAGTGERIARAGNPAARRCRALHRLRRLGVASRPSSKKPPLTRRFTIRA